MACFFYFLRGTADCCDGRQDAFCGEISPFLERAWLCCRSPPDNERKDQAALQDLQQSQLGEMSQFAIDLQRQAQDVEKASLEALAASRSIAEDRASHYGNLADEGLSGMEIIAEASKMIAATVRLGGNASRSAGQFLKISPNVFGLANGGMRYEGPVKGGGRGRAWR